METRVIYSAAATSLDSWDMENLKYLRRLSRSNQLGGQEAEKAGTESYNSGDGDLLSDEEFLHSNGAGSVPGTDYSGQTVVSVNLNNRTNAGAPLDTCYLLDIVTVRNESVLANPIGANPSAADGRVPKEKLGSDGYESSSAGSSIDERNFFDRETEGEPYSDLSGYKTSSMSTIIQRRQSSPRRSSSACPYCDNGNIIGGSRRSSPYFYLGQPRNEVEETSMVPTLGGESAPELPRSPSPYYVRLRRDLYNVPPAYSARLRSPANFGMDQQGQLLIDYTPNWDGLENYIKSLKL